MSKVHINLKEYSYNIIIDKELLKTIPKDLLKREKSKQIIFITNETLYSLYGKRFSQDLQDQGFTVHEYVLPDGERYKTWERAGIIFTKMIGDKINRDAFVIALGGGVVGDLAGFIASIYQRGIKFYQVPTSLLAQVDSSVGGKVAVNHSLGKNMIGSFYQPEKVYIDVELLSTLPSREWKSGLAEIIKYGIIRDAVFFNYIESNLEKIKARDSDVFQYLIKRSCEIKGEIVEKDEKEEGIRAFLNLGHTLAHGIETITEYEHFRHGEAVAAGISIITDLALEKGCLNEEDGQRIQKVFEALEMTYKLPRMPIRLFMDILNRDKKNKNGNLVLIIPEKIGSVKITDKITEKEVEDFLLKRGICRE